MNFVGNPNRYKVDRTFTASDKKLQFGARPNVFERGGAFLGAFRYWARKGYQGYHSYQVDRSGRLAGPRVWEGGPCQRTRWPRRSLSFPLARAPATRLHGIPWHSRRKESVCVPPERAPPPRAIEPHNGVPSGGGGYRGNGELFIYPRNRAAGREQLFPRPKYPPAISRARAAASSFSTFLIVIYNWTRAGAEELSAIDN